MLKEKYTVAEFDELLQNRTNELSENKTDEELEKMYLDYAVMLASHMFKNYKFKYDRKTQTITVSVKK